MKKYLCLILFTSCSSEIVVRTVFVGAKGGYELSTIDGDILECPEKSKAFKADSIEIILKTKVPRDLYSKYKNCFNLPSNKIVIRRHVFGVKP